MIAAAPLKLPLEIEDIKAILPHRSPFLLVDRVLDLETDRRVVHRARRLERYLTQPFFVVAGHTGIAGASVPLDVTLTDCEALNS